MNTVISREVAKSTVLAELSRQTAEPKAWEEMHLFCAIEAIRRGDYDIAVNHVTSLRDEPAEVAIKASRPLHTRERLRGMLERL